MTFSAKAALIKFCRFAPPLITQVATFVATRALVNEYADYGADRAHVPLGAKLTLISITILSAVTGLLTVLGTWKSSEKPKAIKAGDVLLQLVALVIAVWAGSSMLTDHGVLEAEGKKCDGPNARVCLPPVESCADKTKPPCDAHLDLNTAAMADNLDYKNHFGWIDRGDKYRTTQYQSYGSPSDGWGFFSMNGYCSNYMMTTTTASYDAKNYSAAGKVELSMLKEAAVKCERDGDHEDTYTFDCGGQISQTASRCQDVEVEAFDGTKVMTNQCGVNSRLRWSKAAIDAGNLCRYGCIGTNEECLKHGAPESSSDEVIDKIVAKYTNFINSAMTTMMQSSTPPTAQQTADLEAASAGMDEDEMVTDPTMADRTETYWPGADAHNNGGTPSAAETCISGPATFKQACVSVMVGNGLGPISDAGTCFDRDGADSFSTTVAGDCCLDYDAAYGIAGGGGECSAHSQATWMMDCLVNEVDRTTQQLTGNKIKQPNFFCDQFEDAKTKCAHCTDSRIIPCGSDGVNALLMASSYMGRRTNSTIGFGADTDSTRFGPADWGAMEGTWCGAKLLLEQSGGGFFGITTSSVLLMVVGLFTSGWDTITEIKEPNKGKFAFMATGVVLAGLLELCVFLWAPYKMAMLIFIGHDTAPEAAGVSAAFVTEQFAAGAYEAHAGIYDLISIATIVLMFLITAHALTNLVLERAEPKVAAVSAVKLILVLVGTIIIWTPNFAIKEYISLTKSELPAFKAMQAAGDAMIEKGSPDMDEMIAWMTGAGSSSVTPAKGSDIGGNNNGFIGNFVYIITLLITMVDEIEIVLLKQLRKKPEEDKPKFDADKATSVAA